MSNRGFSIIETMLSLIIITIAVIQIASIISHSIKFNNQAKVLFQINQKFENMKHMLLSKPYKSSELKAGKKTTFENGFKIICSIIDKTPTLKTISIFIKKENLFKRYSFFKSKYIN